MSASHDDLSGFGALGPEMSLSDSGVLSVAGSASVSASGAAGGANGHALDPTMITAPHSSLAIDLVWDNSVANAPAGFTAAVDAAAKELVTLLHTASKTILYFDIGWGEVAGGPLPGGAVGASGPNGFLTDYATVSALLTAHGDNLSASAWLPSDVPFFLPGAEAKALGLIPGTAGNVSAIPDGYVGFGALANWYFGATGTGAGQINLQAVALHELTEAMGRVSSEGVAGPFLTPLDLFDFSAPGALSLSPAGGYFSTDAGATPMAVFNNAVANPGSDIGDWATPSLTVPAGEEDAFEAFVSPGVDPILSSADMAEMVALGY